MRPSLLLLCAAAACKGEDSGGIEITGYLDPAKVHLTSEDVLGETPVDATVLGEPGAATNFATVTARDLTSGEEVDGETGATGAFALTLPVALGDAIEVTIPGADAASLEASAPPPFPSLAGIHASAPDAHDHVRVDVTLSAEEPDLRVFATDLATHDVVELTLTTPTQFSGHLGGHSGDHGHAWGVLDGQDTEAHGFVVP